MMINNEIKKLLSPFNIVITAVILLASLLINRLPYNYGVPFSVEIYRDYMEKISGQTAEETSYFIENERERIESLLSTDFSEDMSQSEKYRLEKEIKDAQRKQEAFNAVYEKYEYFNDINGDVKEKPLFFYDLDWRKFLNDDSHDLFLIAFIIAVIIPFFTVDMGDIHPMIFSSKHGREKIITAKIIISVLAVLSLSVLLVLIKWISFRMNFSANRSNTMIYSISDFSKCRLKLSLSGFFVLKSLFYCAWSMAAVCLSVFISLKLKNASFASIIFIFSIFIPFIICSACPKELGYFFTGANISGHQALKEAKTTMPLFICTVSCSVHIILFWGCSVRAWCGSKASGRN